MKGNRIFANVRAGQEVECGVAWLVCRLACLRGGKLA